MSVSYGLNLNGRLYETADSDVWRVSLKRTRVFYNVGVCVREYSL